MARSSCQIIFIYWSFLKRECKGLNSILSGAKRFLAYEIVKGLSREGEDRLLTELQNGVQSNERAKGKLHQVFRLSFDAKLLDDPAEVHEVLDYIHHNPVSGKWNLVQDFADYPHSSAAFYEESQRDIYGCKDFRDFVE